MVDTTSPMRRVVGRWVDERNKPFDVLECGHRKEMSKHFVDGQLHYEASTRRRCKDCAARLKALVVVPVSDSERS